MATKRIDLRVDTNGIVSIQLHDDTMKVEQTKESNFKISGGPWTVKVNAKYINIHCSSKAMDKKRKFTIKLRPCSLFLVSNTTEWYWFVREEEFQTLMDKYNISYITTLTKPEEKVHIDTLMARKDGEWKHADDLQYVINYIGDDVSYEIIPRMNIVGNTSYAGLSYVSLSINFKSFMILEYPGYYMAYLRAPHKLKDIINKNKELFENLTFNSFEKGGN